MRLCGGAVPARGPARRAPSSATHEGATAVWRSSVSAELCNIVLSKSAAVFLISDITRPVLPLALLGLRCRCAVPSSRPVVL